MTPEDLDRIEQESHLELLRDSDVPLLIAEVRRLRLLNLAASHLLMGGRGPETTGPTDWNETRDKWRRESGYHYNQEPTP